MAVYSCADGTLRVEPTWAKRFRSHGALGPGMFTRMHSAYLVESLMAMPRRPINWKKRAAVHPPLNDANRT